MNKQKAERILNLYRECKEKSLFVDPNGVSKKIDFGHAKELFITHLENGGYRCIGDGAYKLVFSKRSVDFVVKVYHTGAVDDKPNKKYKLNKYTVKTYYTDGCIAIQPKVKRNNKNKAYNFLEERLGKDYCEIFDVHPDNVGWLDNKPVIFDYVACTL